MQLNRKTALSAVLLMGGMLVVLVGVSLVAFRQFSIRVAQADAETAAEIVRVTLTESMINGTISHREQLLNRLAQVRGLQSARVIRGPQVINQFGPGISVERHQDEVETEVLSTGAPYFGIVEEGMHPVFRSTIPYVATRTGNPNCLQCHQVPEGSVLGAITLQISVPGLKSAALLSVGLMVLTIAVFGIAMLLLLRRMARPLVTTARDVQKAVGAALQGDFQVHVEPQTEDEIGQIARDFNQLSLFLNHELSTIRDDVAEVIQLPPRGTDSQNLMTNTRRMVEGLVDVAQFKQAVEEDETRHEVYRRLSRVIRDELALEHFAVYEVAASKNRLVKVSCADSGEASCEWCDQQVLVRAEACRARRTGHIIDSIEFPSICNQFRPGDAALEHICIPIIQSGSVGSVVQLVIPRERGREVQQQVPFFHVYLREAAPVLEAKRLMDTLRESNLRDPMTGLHNRRFLEEYVETLVAGTHRRQTRMSLLMLDLDYFKKVNDSYGHDAGDAVLKTLARTMQQAVRRSDLVIRYGGEEFLIILLDTSEGYGDMVAEKIRGAVEQTKIRLAGGTVLEKTISIGVADFPTDSDTFWQAIKFADVALYRAKETGRNRVVHFAPEMWKGGNSEY